MKENHNNKILQICSYFTESSVHKNLFLSLDLYFQQKIFVGVRSNEKLGANYINLKNGEIIYKKIWSLVHRIFYNRKISLTYSYVKSSFDDNNYKLIHAHTWFSDGGVAYLLNKYTKIPYIITIRNTDLNVFYKYRFDLRRFGHKVLKNASMVLFISPGYYNQLVSILPEDATTDLKTKSVIIPNGIEEFWFKNKFLSTRQINKGNTLNLLYVGSIDKNKNLENSIRAFQSLKRTPVRATLTLVGFTNNTGYQKRIKKKYASVENLFFADRITSKKEMLACYRKADIFLMPSFTETFGLVYIEALTQGQPVIYSKGQGIDGYFAGNDVGVAVDPKSVPEIASAIINIYKNYKNFIKKDLSFLDQFRWENIAKEYNKVYASALNI